MKTRGHSCHWHTTADTSMSIVSSPPQRLLDARQGKQQTRTKTPSWLSFIHSPPPLLILSFLHFLLLSSSSFSAVQCTLSSSSDYTWVNNSLLWMFTFVFMKCNFCLHIDALIKIYHWELLALEVSALLYCVCIKSIIILLNDNLILHHLLHHLLPFICTH